MRIVQLADNTGMTDAHRALNYLVVRYPAIYATASERHRQNASLTAVDEWKGGNSPWSAL